MKSLVFLLALGLIGLGGCNACDEDSVCDALEGALEDRSDDCGLTVATSCPYEPAALGPGSGTVCDLAWQCIDKLDSDTVPCSELDGISIASCAAAVGGG